MFLSGQPAGLFFLCPPRAADSPRLFLLYTFQSCLNSGDSQPLHLWYHLNYERGQIVKKTASNRNLLIDIWRIIAALLIVMYHTRYLNLTTENYHLKKAAPGKYFFEK